MNHQADSNYKKLQITKVANNKKTHKYRIWRLNSLTVSPPVADKFPPVLLENKAVWLVLRGENTLWRHCVSGRQNWQAATDNNI